MSDDLVERVAQQFSHLDHLNYEYGKQHTWNDYARAAIAVCMEEAASYCEMKAKHCWGDGRDCCDAALQQTAAAIRALIPK